MVEEVVDVAAEGGTHLAEVEGVAGVEVEQVVGGHLPGLADDVFFAQFGRAGFDVVVGEEACGEVPVEADAQAFQGSEGDAEGCGGLCGAAHVDVVHADFVAVVFGVSRVGYRLFGGYVHDLA